MFNLGRALEAERARREELAAAEGRMQRELTAMATKVRPLAVAWGQPAYLSSPARRHACSVAPLRAGWAPPQAVSWVGSALHTGTGGDNGIEK